MNVADNPEFRSMLSYAGIGNFSEDQIPHRTQLTDRIKDAYRREREELIKEMEVYFF
jgi:hypothetical protein